MNVPLELSSCQPLPLAEIPTPALIIDAARVQANLDRMAAYSRQHGIGIRPHTKTHKSIELARLQLAAGAIGLTVAKAGEAAVMSQASSDILMAYPAIDRHRAQRLAELAEKITMRVAVDSVQAIDSLARCAQESGSEIGILVDIDVGQGRTGVASPEIALQLAQHVAHSPSLRLDGIMIYPGHCWAPPDAQEPILRPIGEYIQTVLDLWKRHDLHATIVSGGSTPTAYQSHFIPQLTEIRPGTYIFNDLNEYRAGYCRLEDCAATIMATVISDAVKNQVVLDSGSKTLTSDLCGPAKESGHGMILEFPQAKIVKLSEEHAQVDVTHSTTRPHLGDRVTIVPNHICPCMNLIERAWWLMPDGLARPLSIDARGRLS